MKNLIGEAAALIGIIAAVFAQGVCVSAESKNGIEQDVFRLHIIANSDSEADQQLKLKVRDAVLEAGGEIFSGNSDAEQAAAEAEENMELFRKTARDVISENGFDYDVECEVADVDFDERVYGNATFPEGNYRALRIKIGKAEGKNWWCVMFPPLCLPAVTNTDEVLTKAEADGALTAEEISIIRDPQQYEVRFYFAEIFRKLKDYISMH